MDLEAFPASEAAKRMLSYVTPGFYDKSYVGKWLYEVMGREMDKTIDLFEELPFQAFPETATWGLGYLEEKYGLPNRKDLPDQERRRIICQKRDTRAPMTPFAMERLLKTVTEFNVSVLDSNDVVFENLLASHPNVFKVILAGDGTAEIIKIRTLLDQVKQSHTVYGLSYYEHSEYEERVVYENTICFRTGFYPRYNLAFLNLDRMWKLDGSRYINGYDGESYVDFYPAVLCIQAPVKEMAGTGQGIRLKLAMKEGISSGAVSLIRNEVSNIFKGAEKISFHLTAKEGTSAGQVQVMNRNILDHGWKLDGSRRLNGGLSIL